MTKDHIGLWSSQVQPLVDNNYKHDSSGVSAGVGVRADVGWSWSAIYRYAAIHSLTFQSTYAMCLVVKQVGAPEFPIGMLTVVPQLPCTAFGMERSRGFAWYLADAPSEVYQYVLKTPRIKGVATALIDCSLQTTIEVGGDGTHLLHADPNGGLKLTDFYSGLGMDRLGKEDGPITRWFRRSNPEQYFHFDDVQARAFCAKFNPRR